VFGLRVLTQPPFSQLCIWSLIIQLTCYFRASLPVCGGIFYPHLMPFCRPLA